MRKILGVGLIVFVIDQIVKLVINTMVSLERSISVLGDFFQITYVRNYGAAFNILTGNRFFLILIACMTLFLLLFFLRKEGVKTKVEQIGYGLFIGGIVGNLWDRLIYGYVIDYLDFELFHIHMPIFNLADVCICFGVCLCIYALLKEEFGWKSLSKKVAKD